MYNVPRDPQIQNKFILVLIISKNPHIQKLK